MTRLGFRQLNILVNIRNGGANDIPLIMKLERSCAWAAHWSEAQYRFALTGQREPERIVIVAEAGGSDLSGLLVARQVAPEWELENIAVVETARRQGIGSALLAALLQRVRSANGKKVWLEVRESNRSARKLYEKTGFRESGRRKGYYLNPPEDAVVYSQEIV